VAVLANRPFAEGGLFQRVRAQAVPPWAAEFDCDSWAQFLPEVDPGEPGGDLRDPGHEPPQHMVDNLKAAPASSRIRRCATGWPPTSERSESNLPFRPGTSRFRSETVAAAQAANPAETRAQALASKLSTSRGHDYHGRARSVHAIQARLGTAHRPPDRLFRRAPEEPARRDERSRVVFEIRPLQPEETDERAAFP
jgi:hypothetical protein